MTPTIPTALAATIKTLPDRPGVYLMKGAKGEVLYVGKAQILRSRVRSYWQKESPTADLQLITHQANDPAPAKVKAAIDLGLVGISILYTWTRRIG